MRELNNYELEAVSGGFDVRGAMSSLANYSILHGGSGMAFYKFESWLSGNETSAAGYGGAFVGGLVGGLTKFIPTKSAGKAASKADDKPGLIDRIKGVPGAIISSDYVALGAEGVFNSQGGIPQIYRYFNEQEQALNAI